MASIREVGHLSWGGGQTEATLDAVTFKEIQEDTDSDQQAPK